MSVQEDIWQTVPVVTDALTARYFGHLKRMPIATEQCATAGCCPQIFFGRDNRPLIDLDEKTFVGACRLSSMTADAKWWVSFPAEQVYIETYSGNGNRWSNTVDVYVRHLMQKHDFNGAFKSSLQRLTIVGPGTSLQIPDTGHTGGSFASVLVDLPFAFKDGVINVTRENRTDSFNFSTAFRNKISFLHWFHGTQDTQHTVVTIEPISSGLRAFLIYDVFMDPTSSISLTLAPDSTRMRNYEACIQALVRRDDFMESHPKTCFLPLVRIMVSTYRAMERETPRFCLTFYYLVVDSYERRKREATTSATSQVVLSNLRKEGIELVSSFGGRKSMQRLFARGYVNELTDSIQCLGH